VIYYLPNFDTIQRSAMYRSQRSLAYSNRPPSALLDDTRGGGVIAYIMSEGRKVGLDGLGAHLANRTYWTRMWILQETGVASDIVITCGDDPMRWLHFYQAFLAIQSLSGKLRHTSMWKLKALGLVKHVGKWRNKHDWKDMGL